MATSNKGIRFGLNNRVTVITTIVGAITAFNYNRGEGGATMENPLSNTRYAIGDGDGGDGGEGVAITERSISNTRYAIGDGDGGEGGAIPESLLSYAR